MNIKRDIITPSTIALQNYFPYLSSVLSPFLATHKVWEAVFYSAIGLYGVYMAYNQEEVNEIVKFITEHPEEFREEIVKSKEFQKGFLTFTESYLKERVEEKKKILQKILLGFTSASEKEKYQLERQNDCLRRMSVESLEFLIFLKKEILPSFEIFLQEELQKDMYQKSDRSVEWWHNQLFETQSIWGPLNNWIQENYNQNSNKVKTQYGMLQAGWPPDILKRIESLERAKRSEIIECLSEFVTLGLIRMKVDGGTLTYNGGGGSDYNFTSFGRQFLTVIDISTS